MPHSKTRPRVLIVDDDPGVLSGLERVLASEGFAVAVAMRAHEALMQFAAETPDLVLLDIGLGGANGWDLFEIISRESPQVPVIIITARSGQWEVAQVAGVAALVEKPIEIPELVETMRSLLADDDATNLARLAKRLPPPRFIARRPED